MPRNHGDHPNGYEDDNVTRHSISVNRSTYEANKNVTITVEEASGTFGPVVKPVDGGHGPDHCTVTNTLDHRTKITKEPKDEDRKLLSTPRETKNCCVDEKITLHRESYD